MILGSSRISAVCQIPFSEETFFFFFLNHRTQLYLTEHMCAKKHTSEKLPYIPPQQLSAPTGLQKPVHTDSHLKAQSPHVFLLSGGD